MRITRTRIEQLAERLWAEALPIVNRLYCSHYGPWTEQSEQIKGTWRIVARIVLRRGDWSRWQPTQEDDR